MHHFECNSIYRAIIAIINPSIEGRSIAPFRWKMRRKSTSWSMVSVSAVCTIGYTLFTASLGKLWFRVKRLGPWQAKWNERGERNSPTEGFRMVETVEKKRGRATEKKKLKEREGKRRKKYKTLGKRERSRGYVQFRGRSCVCIVSRATRRRECKMRKNRSLGKVDRRETRSGEKNWTRGISLARYLPLPRSVSVELFARGPRMKIVTRSGASGENVFHARAKVPEEARPIGINDSRWNALLRSLIHVDSDRLWSHTVIFRCGTIIWFLLSEC